jgi:predicted PurR-regulated permease PerM
MNEIVITIIGAIVTAIILPLIALGGKALINYINNKIKDEKLKAALTQAVELAEKSVDMIAQTYVDDLKKKGEFTANTQTAALNYALDNAKKLLAPEVTALIAANVGNLDDYLKTAMEAYIKNKK